MADVYTSCASYSTGVAQPRFFLFCFVTSRVVVKRMIGYGNTVLQIYILSVMPVVAEMFECCAQKQTRLKANRNKLDGRKQ